jgi:hypothetical protein
MYSCNAFNFFPKVFDNKPRKILSKIRKKLFEMKPRQVVYCHNTPAGHFHYHAGQQAVQQVRDVLRKLDHFNSNKTF